jgi:glycerol-3-phosphate acyltransferase PlsY
VFDDRILSADALPFLWPYALCALLAYLLGSIPFGLVLTRMAGQGDIRKIGSGSIGATNVLRTGNKFLAAATLLLDAGKGAAAVLIGLAFGGHDFAVIAALMAIAGHLFSIWLRFQGGKGIAAGLGVMLALSWPAGLISLLLWIVVAVAARISSLASLIAALSAPISMWFFTHDMQFVQVTALIALLIVIKHHSNIRRLLRGEEPRIGK